MLDPGGSGPIMSGCSFQEAVSADETSKFSRDENDPAGLSHCAQLDVRRDAQGVRPPV
jgi:hypothetical protein